MQRVALEERFLTTRERLARLAELASGGSQEREQALETALSELGLALEELEVAGEEVWQQNEELLQIREELETEQVRYRELFERAPAGYLVTGRDGSILQANRAATRMLGVRSDLLPGKPLAVFVAAVDRHSFRTRLLELGGVEVEWRDEWTMHLDSRNGRRLTVDVLVNGTRGEGGRQDRLLWSLREVADEADDRDDDVRLEGIARVARGVAHETTELLASLRTLVGLLPEPATGDDELGPAVAGFESALARGAALTRSLNAFACRQSLRPRPVNLTTLVGSTALRLRKSAAGRFEVVLALEPDLEDVTVDPEQIQDVLLRLADNSREAMPAGGRLTIRTFNLPANPRRRSEPGSGPRTDRVMLSVSDTGCGIDPSLRSRLFEPFFTTKEMEPGAGLGLSMVYGTVKQNAGSISVRSEQGLGTTIDMVFPVAQEPGTPAVPNDSLVATRTILLAEDDGLVRSLATELLRAEGFNVLSASDGREALRTSERHAGRIDLLVTDVRMPQLNGPDLAARFAAGRPEGSVLFMSGYDREHVVEAEGVPPDARFILKPFSADAFLSAVREVLHATDQVE